MKLKNRWVIVITLWAFVGGLSPAARLHAQESGFNESWAQEQVSQHLLRALFLERLITFSAPEVLTPTPVVQERYDEYISGESSAFASKAVVFGAAEAALLGLFFYFASRLFSEADALWAMSSVGSVMGSVGYSFVSSTMSPNAEGRLENHHLRHKNHTVTEAITTDPGLRQVLRYDEEVEAQLERRLQWFGAVFGQDAESLALLKTAIADHLVKQQIEFARSKRAGEKQVDPQEYSVDILSVARDLRRGDGTPLFDEAHYSAATALREQVTALRLESERLVAQNPERVEQELSALSSTDAGRLELEQKMHALQAVVAYLEGITSVELGSTRIPTAKAAEFVAELRAFAAQTKTTLKLIQGHFKPR